MAVLQKLRSAEKGPPDQVDLATKFHPGGWLPEGMAETTSSTQEGGFRPSNSTRAGGPRRD